MKKIVSMIILLSVLVMTLPINLSAKEKNVSKYKETKLNVKFNGNCEEGIWWTNLNKEGNLQAFEWDTVVESDNHYLKGYEIIWKGKKQTVKPLKLPKEISKKIISVNGKTFRGLDGNLYIINTINEGKKRILYAIDKDGRLLKELDLSKILKTNDVVTQATQINKSKMAVVTGGTTHADYEVSTIFILDLKTNKVISKKKLKTSVEMIKGSYVYGFSHDKSNRECLDVIDLNTYKKVNRVKLPKSPNNRLHIDVKGGYIYTANAEGVYRIKNKSKHWIKVMECQYNGFLKKRHIGDITVKDKNTIYILFSGKHDGHAEPIIMRYTK